MSTDGILRKEEGKSLKLYKCSAGYLTIGIGYNIEARGLPDDIVEELYRRDLAELQHRAAQIPEYRALDPVRAGVVARMVFQMGVDGVLAFRKFRAALAAEDWPRAYTEMLDSEWYLNKNGRGTPARAKREAEIMLRGIE